MSFPPDTLAVEVADSYGRHLTTIDGFRTVEEAVAYWRSTRPASAKDSAIFLTDAELVGPDDPEPAFTVGAELRDPITGALRIQFVAHPAGWVPVA